MKKLHLLPALFIAFGSAFTAVAETSTWEKETENFLLSADMDDRIHISELSQDEKASGVYLRCNIKGYDAAERIDRSRELVLFLNASQEYYMKHSCSASLLKWKMSVRAESYVFHTLLAPPWGWNFTDLKVSRVNGQLQEHSTRVAYVAGERYDAIYRFKSGTCQRIEPIVCPALNTQF